MRQSRNTFRIAALAFVAVTLPGANVMAAEANLRVTITWGHEQSRASTYSVALEGQGGADLSNLKPVDLEAGEGLQQGAWVTQAGASDTDGIQFQVKWDATRTARRDPMQIIWADLISASDADTARRLTSDPALEKDPPRVAVRLKGDFEAKGFTVALSQLVANKAIWIPALGMYVTGGAAPPSFEEHLRSLSQWKGARTLDRLERDPEATYAEYAHLWENMGSPSYVHPAQMGPGHIIGLSWDSSIEKFGIDRGAGVWNDYGSPNKFHVWFDFGDLNHELASRWRGQTLSDGLPVVKTHIEDHQTSYEVEQFAYPLNGPPKERRGDIPMVLLEQVRVTNLSKDARSVPLTLHQRRPLGQGAKLVANEATGRKIFQENLFGRTALEIEGACELLGQPAAIQDTRDGHKDPHAAIFLTVDLAPGETKSIVVKLPSGLANKEETAALKALDFSAARAETVHFWSDYLDKGAQFHVPDEAVNTLYRASLWHALRLPRRHGGSGKNVAIDLPFSNFAYDQKGTPWPVNQAVYVDYMLYGLRGYQSVALEELLTQYRNNQEESGRIGGYAHWGVYTPSMLYASAQYFLLTGDRAGFEQLLPQSLRALAWCLQQTAGHRRPDGTVVRNLLYSGLNDLTGSGEWAFNQAYLYAGLHLFGKALAQYGHPRAEATMQAAEAVRHSVAEEFANASAKSTVVQLRDHTWIPYVPSNTETPRRLMDIWYPTDVDTGAVHLLRLGALDANGSLADWLLNDQEDNLFYRNLGAANEPVYAQHANAYLLRDEVKPLIRAFYSLMASGFSQKVFEPVEHRWTWGQYFGSPCTDGAWFELYRNMLLHETDDGSLILGLGTPRAWLADGKTIDVKDAPTYFGRASFHVESHTAENRISASVTLEYRKSPQKLMVRLRHPQGRRLKAVSVNGTNWRDFNPEREWIVITKPSATHFSIEATY